MDVLETLAVALGFASLAGVNLYLTVLVTGLAVHFQWIILPAKYGDLAILGEPAILIAAGTFAALEFFSDKIPWVDSAWDSVHTLIRPIGGGLLALSAMGQSDPTFAVIVAMLASGASLMTHGLKAGTRIAINQSPEPVSNVAASLTEDMAVVGGLAMMSISPTIFAVICVVFVATAIFMAPRLYRRTRAFSWLFWRKVGAYFTGNRKVTDLTLPITMEDEVLLKNFCDSKPKDVSWSFPVILGASNRFAKFTPNTFGKVFSLESEEGELHFIGRKRGKHYHAKIDLKDLAFIHEPRFASDDLVLENNESGRRLVMKLPCGSEALIQKVITELTESQIPVKSIETNNVSKSIETEVEINQS